MSRKNPWTGTEIRYKAIDQSGRAFTVSPADIEVIGKPKVTGREELRSAVRALGKRRDQVLDALHANPRGETAKALSILEGKVADAHRIYSRAADTEKGEGLAATVRNAQASIAAFGERMAAIGSMRPKVLDPGKPTTQSTLFGVRHIPAIPDVQMHSTAAQQEYNRLKKTARSKKTPTDEYRSALKKLAEMRETGEIPGQRGLFEAEARPEKKARKTLLRKPKLASDEQGSLFERQQKLFQVGKAARAQIESPEFKRWFGKSTPETADALRKGNEIGRAHV